MTEKEAWLKIAEAWENVERGERGYVVEIGDDCAAGLCGSIYLIVKNAVGLSFHPDVMYDKIKALPHLGDDFVWPRDAEGAKARAAFCVEQARLLGEER